MITSIVNFPIINSQNINFLNGRHIKIAGDNKDIFENQRNAMLAQITNALKSVGVKAKKKNDNSITVFGLNKISHYKNGVCNGIPLSADYILQFTREIQGSTNFGAIGATTLGKVKTMQKTALGGSKFDISTSEILSLGRLEKVDGSLIINTKQLDKMNFEGLEVTGDIIVATNLHGKNNYKKLDKYHKNALLAGFNLLTY